jgi:hypothetical protein
MRNRIESHALALTMFCTALGGCVVAPPMIQQPYDGRQPMPAPSEAWPPVEQTELIPPLPTFLTLRDCELAYGPGACGIGSSVYGQASLAPPPDAYNWYMPYSFGTMTGALLHDHYAPPGIYRAQVPYWSYLQPVVIQRYALVDPRTVQIYRSAPLVTQQRIITIGPAPYPLQRGDHHPPGFDRGPNQPPGFGPFPGRGRPSPEPVMRAPAPNLVTPPAIPPATPTTMPPNKPSPNFQTNPANMPPAPMVVPQKPTPMPHGGLDLGPQQLPPRSVAPNPANLNPAPNPRQNQGQRPDRPERPGPGSSGSRPGDRNAEERK